MPKARLKALLFHLLDLSSILAYVYRPGFEFYETWLHKPGMPLYTPDNSPANRLINQADEVVKTLLQGTVGYVDVSHAGDGMFMELTLLSCPYSNAGVVMPSKDGSPTRFCT